MLHVAEEEEEEEALASSYWSSPNDKLINSLIRQAEQVVMFATIGYLYFAFLIEIKEGEFISVHLKIDTQFIQSEQNKYDILCNSDTLDWGFLLILILILSPPLLSPCSCVLLSLYSCCQPITCSPARHTEWV